MFFPQTGLMWPYYVTVNHNGKERDMDLADRPAAHYFRWIVAMNYVVLNIQNMMTLRKSVSII